MTDAKETRDGDGREDMGGSEREQRHGQAPARVADGRQRVGPWSATMGVEPDPDLAGTARVGQRGQRPRPEVRLPASVHHQTSSRPRAAFLLHSTRSPRARSNFCQRREPDRQNARILSKIHEPRPCLQSATNAIAIPLRVRTLPRLAIRGHTVVRGPTLSEGEKSARQISMGQDTRESRRTGASVPVRSSVVHSSLGLSPPPARLRSPGLPPRVCMRHLVPIHTFPVPTSCHRTE